MRALKLIPVLLVGVLAAAGCTPSARKDRIAEFLANEERQAGVPLQVAGPVTLPDGSELVLYTYRKGDQCGYGYTNVGWISEGSSSGGGGPCEQLEINSGPASFGGILFGAVRAPNVAKVVVHLPDGTQQEAFLGDGVWFLKTPREFDPELKGVQAEALDGDGHVLAQAPSNEDQ